MKSSTQRVITALVGAPVVLAAAWVGGWWFLGLVVLASLGAQYEFYSLSGLDRQPATLALGLAAGAVILLRPLVGPDIELILLTLVAAIVASTIVLHRSGRAMLHCSVAFAGIVYPTLMFSYMIELRLADAIPGVTRHLTLMTILAVWAADSAAYYSGRAFGRRKITPISPNKTWEGFYGGFAGAVLAAVIIAVAFGGPVSVAQAVVVGAICGLLGPVGDIAESALKRSAHVKDSGSLLPGHGGLLDRLDALIFVSPILYVWARIEGLL